MGDLEYAMHCLLKSVELDSSNAEAFYYLGYVNAVKGRFEDAEELFAHTLDIRPKHLCALRDSAIVYLQMGRLDDAAKRIKRARAVDSSDLRLNALAE